MINISFDNVYILFILLPLLALVIVPFCIAIRKDNRSVSVVTSLILHVVMVLLIGLAAAGTTLTAVMTETEVYVVADVSYSANKNLSEVDKYIREVKKELPRNSKLGVVCFAKDYVLHTELGKKFDTVTNAEVDDGATDIQGALEYTSTLYSEGVIKKLVLITDGKDSREDAASVLINEIERLYAQNIQIEAMYLDDNIKEGVKEVQVDSVDYVKNTYLGRTETATVLLRSSYDAVATLTLKKNGELVEENSYRLSVGYNAFTYTLDTSAEGESTYEILMTTREDECLENNRYTFTQRVTGKANVLLVSKNQADYTDVSALYGANSTVKFVDPTKEAVPFTVEGLCKYDEIVLSGVNLREISNFESFAESLHAVVERFGKSLVTIGDLGLQSETLTEGSENEGDKAVALFEGLLPLSYGNANLEKKYVAIVLDASRSMPEYKKFENAKSVAKGVLDGLSEKDSFSIVAFWGENINLVYQSEATPDKIADAKAQIDKLEAKQGTLIGDALQLAFSHLKADTTYQNKQVMLITDGESYGSAAYTPETVISEMRTQGIRTNIVNTCRDASSSEAYNRWLQADALAAMGGGKAFYIDSNTPVDVTLADISDDVRDEIVEKEEGLQLKVQAPRETILDGLEKEEISKKEVYLKNLSVNGYVNNSAKSRAEVVLTAKYEQDVLSIDVPVYAYWKYSEGRVACFASNFAWTQSWKEGGTWAEGSDGVSFYRGIFQTNLPTERRSEPFEVTLTNNGGSASLQLLPVRLNPDATLTLEVVAPDGTKEQTDLPFQTNGYSYSFDTPQTGQYLLNLTYTTGQTGEQMQLFFDVSYSPEYDAFAGYDVAELHRFIRHRGRVTTDGTVDLSNRSDEVATFTLPLTLPFAVAVVVLFVVDVIVRKLKWSDVKGLFKKRKSNINTK